MEVELELEVGLECLGAGEESRRRLRSKLGREALALAPACILSF